MIKYEEKYIKPYGDDREVISFNILSPYQNLCIIQGISNIEDLDLDLEWIEELVNRDIPDYSEAGFILYQPFLWGSKKLQNPLKVYH